MRSRIEAKRLDTVRVFDLGFPQDFLRVGGGVRLWSGAFSVAETPTD